MRRIHAAVVIGAMAGLLFSVAPATAHDYSTYFENTWDTEFEDCQFIIFDCTTRYRNIEYYRIGVFTGGQLNRVTQAAAETSAVHEFVNLTTEGFAGSLNTCDGDYQYNMSTVRWEQMGWDPNGGNVLATATTCTLASNSEIVFFEISYNRGADDAGVFSYVDGSSTPPTDEYHFIGTAMHEFLHGVGFGTGGATAQHFNQSSICTDDDTRHIMCQHAIPGVNRGSPRVHDAHTTSDAYNAERR